MRTQLLCLANLDQPAAFHHGDTRAEIADRGIECEMKR
jgi:hypothetical protein